MPVLKVHRHVVEVTQMQMWDKGVDTTEAF
jgi:hypothetical protein